MEVKNHTKHGYDSIKVISGPEVKKTSIKKPQLSNLTKLNLPVKKVHFEIRYPDNSLNSVELKTGDSLINFNTIESYIINSYVDITTDQTKGKGFAGVMKRYNFGGMEASHGVSVTHRSHGATGSRQDPGKVFKNKKMAGHMGSVRCTAKNIKVIGFIADQKTLIVKGSIPGLNNGFVRIKNAVNYVKNSDQSVLNGVEIIKKNS
jgi:large subunit ribosomal protein L3